MTRIVGNGQVANALAAMEAEEVEAAITLAGLEEELEELKEDGIELRSEQGDAHNAEATITLTQDIAGARADLAALKKWTAALRAKQSELGRSVEEQAGGPGLSTSR